MKNNLLDWNTEDVINWLKSEVKFGDFNYDYNIIKSHNLNGQDLLDLTEDNLKYDLKIVNLHDRKYVMRRICELMKTLVDINIGNNPCMNNNKVKKIMYKGSTIMFRCVSNIKASDLINESCILFCIENAGLCDKEGLIIPRECLINEIDDDEFILKNNLDKDINEIKDVRNSNSNDNINSMNKLKNPMTLRISNNPIPKQQLHRKINSSISETVSKNKFLSFEALDNFEKNGYSFNQNKNISNIEKDKVTINSYYNISNLNNFNNENSEGNTAKNNISPRKKNKLSCVSLRAKKKIDFDDLSQLYEDQVLYTQDDKKLDIDAYMNRLISYKNGTIRNNVSCNVDQSKYFDRLNNYYKDAKRIKAGKECTNGKIIFKIRKTN
jgi:hypothetical protein